MSHKPQILTAMLQYLIDAGALFVINHSGGKDSQAMALLLRQIVPDNQLVVIHAHLPEVDWGGAREHILNTTQGLQYYEVIAVKTFFQMVERRGMWPGMETRQCTSDLKRDPIDKQIRMIAKERGCTLIISCMGLRAEESPGRAKKPVFRIQGRNSKAGRMQYMYLPIHELTEKQVFQVIADAGQQPHPVYAQGMRRFSCRFCIYSTIEDLQKAEDIQPGTAALWNKYERLTGHSFIAPKNGQEPVFLDKLIRFKD
jgi:DNA sulfur modification protein DndC